MSVVSRFGEGHLIYGTVTRRWPPHGQVRQHRPARPARPAQLGGAAGRGRAAEAVPGRRAAMADEEEDVTVSG